MRVLVNLESLRPPLTGIGRYAAHLVDGLLPALGAASVLGFAGSRLVDPQRAVQAALGRGAPADARQGGAGDEAASGAPPARLLRAHRLKSLARRLPGAYPLKVALAERGLRAALRGITDAVYHEPNFLLRRYDGPAVATIHDLSFIHYPQFHPAERVRYVMRHLPRTLERADRILTDSEFVRQELLARFGLRADRVHAVPLGVDAAFAPHEPDALRAGLAPLGLRPGGYLLSVATFEPRKNLERLVRAFLSLPVALQAHRPLVLAGAPGWRAAGLEKLLRQGEAERRVIRLGWVDERRLPALYAGAALFAFASVYEGFGLPLLEAMASGVPVVASDSSSMPEIVGDAGLRVDPLDERAIAAALERGLTDEAWRAQAARRGLQRAAGFTWQACVERTIAVYRLARSG